MVVTGPCDVNMAASEYMILRGCCLAITSKIIRDSQKMTSTLTKGILVYTGVQDTTPHMIQKL
jgi:hypothetical protein